MIEEDTYRLDAIARVLADYATGVASEEKVLVIMREPETFSLVRSVAARCVERGAHVQTLFYSMDMQSDLLKRGNVSQIGHPSEVWRLAMKWADVCIDIRGAGTLAAFSDIPADRIALLRKAEGEVSALRNEQTRWTIIRVPNESFALQAGRSPADIRDQFFRSVLQDWEAEAQRYHRLRDALSGSREIEIIGTDTDLSFSVEDRLWISDDGRMNVPGGEVYTAPVEESVRGVISFDHPGVLAGVLMDGIRLEFREGIVVDARARTNEEFLHELLSMDDGSRRIGEFGIGTNRAMGDFTNDILWDEKISGTVHIALGRSYTECGGVNSSSLHWDIVKDMRTEGTIVVDGRTVFEDGTWLIPW